MSVSKPQQRPAGCRHERAQTIFRFGESTQKPERISRGGGVNPYRQSRIRRQLEIRAQVLRAVREFFQTAGYLEVETPIRIPTPAPEAHIEASPAGEWFLQTSPELCMKRLLAAGYEKIFQICACFRAGERGDRHLPEMTLLEWYTAQADYRDMMAQCEQLIKYVVNYLGPPGLHYQGLFRSITAP